MNQKQQSTWIARCPKCEWQSSLEALGWTRKYAFSVGKRTRLACPDCQTHRFMRILKINESGEDVRPSGKLIAIVCTSILAGIGLVGCGVFFLVMNILQNHDVYKMGVAASTKHPVVVEELGEPLTAEIFRGSIKNRDANIHIPISGPKGSGTANVLAHYDNGEWTLTSVKFAKQDADGDNVELLDDIPNR
jgi:hypothetical protein